MLAENFEDCGFKIVVNVELLRCAIADQDNPVFSGQAPEIK